jgi:DNA-binding CsgD family transcriptional regulator
MHNDVVSAIYDAALGSRPWASALPKLRRVTGAHRLMLKLAPVGASNDGKIYSDSPSGEADWAPDGPATNYQKRYQYEDPVRYNGMVQGEIRQLEDLIDRETFTASAFYREQCEPLGIDHAFFGYLGRIDGCDAWLSGSRGSDQGPFNSAEIASARELLPHLSRAVLMQQRTARLAGQSAVYAESVSALGVGAILLDRNGTIIDSNDEASQILAGQSAITRVGGRLRLTGSAQQTYVAALSQLAKDADVAARSLVAPDGGTSVNLMIRRAIDLVSGNAHDPVAFIVYLTRVIQPLPHGAIDFAMQAFGLSQSEAKLSVLLANGCTLEESAGRLGVTRTTARTYCKRALTKTGTMRQSELVRLILSSLARLA